MCQFSLLNTILHALLMPKFLHFFYDITWSGRSYTTCPGRGAVLQYAMFGTQFNNMLWSGHSFTTCHGWDTVLRALVGTQLFDMSWSGSSYSTFPERGIVL